MKHLSLAALMAFSFIANARINDTNLIGGKVVTDKEAFSSTVDFIGNCTASKIAEHHFLIAAHCVVNYDNGDLRKDYLPGGKFSLKTHRQNASIAITIKKAYAFKGYVEKVKEFLKGGEFPGYSAGYVASDVAIIEVAEKTPVVNVGKISFAEVRDGEEAFILGYGCERSANGGGANLERLKSEKTTVQEITKLAKDFKFDKDEVYHANFFTDGVRLNSGSASLCPGDSGGPVYRKNANNEEEIIGVNSFYTFVDGSGVSYLNLHTRFNHSEIEEWMRSIVEL